jgi:hypothetical protein
MSGKTVAAALAVLAVWSSACAGLSRPATANQQTSAQTRATSAKATPVPVCFGAMPADWAHALRARSITTARGLRFVPGAVAGGVAYGQFNSAAHSGIGRLDLSTGKLTTISRFGPAVGGMGAMAIDPPWLVWEQTDSQTDLGDWSIRVRNLASGTGSVLATPPRLSDGRDGLGYIPSPTLRNGFAAWSEPTLGLGGYQAQVRVAKLATGRVSTLDAGQVSTPVYAGPYLIWGKTDSAGRDIFRVVDAASFRPVVTPGPLRNPGHLVSLTGSPGYLAWSSGDANTLAIWPVAAPRLLEFTQSYSGHRFQYLQLAGRFVLWYTGNGSSVLDLRTGNAFDVQGPVAGSEDAIAIEEPVAYPPTKGTFVPSRVSTVAMAAAPGIRGCAR